MSQPASKSVVTVTIAGEEYTLRADATPDYTRECAEYVDRAVAEIRGQGGLVDAHKAVILSSLSLADQLFQARREAESLRREIASLTTKLASDIDAALASEDLAPRS
jgi:cell division protein ZapA